MHWKYINLQLSFLGNYLKYLKTLLETEVQTSGT